MHRKRALLALFYNVLVVHTAIGKKISEKPLRKTNAHHIAVAPLAWVPWVPGKPSNFKQWVPEPINFGIKALNSTVFSVQSKLEVGVGTFN